MRKGYFNKLSIGCDEWFKLLALSAAERFQQCLAAIKAINLLFTEFLVEQIKTSQVIDGKTTNYYGAFKLNCPVQ